MGKKTLLVTQAPIPLENISLGCLVPDIMTPTQDAYGVPVPSRDDITTAPQKGYTRLVERYRKTSLRAHLIVLGFDLSNDVDDKFIVKATTGKLYELRDPKTWFARIRATVEAKAWLQTMEVGNRDVFFVTGLRTLTDARVTLNHKRGNERGGDLDVPVDTIAAATGLGVPLSLGLGAGGGLTRERSDTSEMDFFAPGEQGYAVQYRRVKISVKSGFESLATATEWRDVLTQRGGQGGADIYQAQLDNAWRPGLATEEVGDDDDEDLYLVSTS